MEQREAPKARRRTARSEPAAPPAASVQTEEIARRAYQFYLDRGRDEGHALDDWLRAEAEFRAKGH
jgi:hypothetical protein